MRRLGIVLVLAFGLLALVAIAPAGPATPVAAAHPEPGDMDGDGRWDWEDNCPQTRNGDQADTDGDGQGDRCDTDADNDGVANPVPYYDPRPNTADDNCPLVPNPDQAPSSQNPRYGAVCYVDSDGDGVADPEDNCAGTANAGQADHDYDRTGDVCDPDNDEDGEFDTADNCPRVYNALQEDADGDGVGSACDDSEVASGGGGGPGGSTGARDRSAPVVRVRLARTQRLRELGRSLAVQVRCSEGCAVRARLRMRGRTAARGTAALAGGGTTYVFMRLQKRVVRRLGKARLTVTVTDEAGNSRRARRTIRLRR